MDIEDVAKLKANHAIVTFNAIIVCAALPLVDLYFYNASIIRGKNALTEIATFIIMGCSNFSVLYILMTLIFSTAMSAINRTNNPADALIRTPLLFVTAFLTIVYSVVITIDVFFTASALFHKWYFFIADLIIILFTMFLRSSMQRTDNQ